MTSNEEAEALDGTVKVVETLPKRNVPLDFCVVGEPTYESRPGRV